MATRQKTTWWGTKLDADVVDATVTNLDQMTLYAEAGRTFRALLVWIAFQDIVTVTGGTIGEHRCGLRFGAAAYTTVTELDDLTNTGENIAGVFGPFDFTAQATSNFGAGSSQTCDIQVYFDQTTGTTLGMRNVNALCALTYDFDDTTATQYTSAWIPLESTTTALGTTETEIGTNQIPQLTGSGGLLENVASVVVRDQFFVVEANSALSAATTDPVLNIRIDTGTTKTFNATEAALQSDTFQRFIYKATPSTSAVHAFKMWSTGAGRFNHAAICMVVTYEWVLSGTTSFLNSLLLPFHVPTPMGGTAAADNSRVTVEFYVEEPATVTLRQSAVRLYWVPGAAAQAGLNLRMGGQAYRAYTQANAVVCGGSVLHQRIDSGGAQGSGLTLARGKNTLTIDLYQTDGIDVGWMAGGFVVLNYTSGVDGDGPAAHNHTVWHAIGFDWGVAVAGPPGTTSSAVAPSIPDTAYWVNGVGYLVCQWSTTGVAGQGMHEEAASGEGPEDGWVVCTPMSGIIKDAEIGLEWCVCDASHLYDRHPDETDAHRLALETARRRKRTAITNMQALGIAMLVTYHSITFSKTTTVSGESGGGTVTVGLFRKTATESELVKTGSRAGNGTIDFVWYDNTETMFFEGIAQAGEAGRSEPFTFAD